MSKHIFQGIETEKVFDGWPLGFATGNSGIDGKDYSVGTTPMSGSEIPDACTDAKTFCEFAAGLLNAFYSGVDVSKWSEEQVMKCGRPVEETSIPHPANPELPF